MKRTKKSLDAEAADSLKNDRFVEFDLGEQSYAIPLLLVQEVIPRPKTTAIPNAPAYFLGIINLRGQVITILDMRSKLKIKPKEAKEEAVIIVVVNRISVGILVDSINKVMSVESKDLNNTEGIASCRELREVRSIVKGEKGLTSVLNLDHFLNLEELENLKARSAA